MFLFRPHICIPVGRTAVCVSELACLTLALWAGNSRVRESKSDPIDVATIAFKSSRLIEGLPAVLADRTYSLLAAYKAAPLLARTAVLGLVFSCQLRHSITYFGCQDEIFLFFTKRRQKIFTISTYQPLTRLLLKSIENVFFCQV